MPGLDLLAEDELHAVGVGLAGVCEGGQGAGEG